MLYGSPAVLCIGLVATRPAMTNMAVEGQRIGHPRDATAPGGGWERWS